MPPRKRPEPVPVEHFGPIEHAVRADLTTAGVAASALGQVAITLAHRIDSAGTEPVAALAKELRAALADAIPKDPPSVDVLAELLDRLSTPVRNS